MALDAKLRPHEISALAIKSEIDATSFYSGLEAKVKNALLQQKLGFLAFEEKKHRKILERLFSQRYSNRKLIIPEKGFVPAIPVPPKAKMELLELFNAALEAEKLSEEFYKEAGKKAEDERSQKMLAYLGRVERSHYFLITSEIDLLRKFPDYYDVEDFHLGP